MLVKMRSCMISLCGWVCLLIIINQKELKLWASKPRFQKLSFSVSSVLPERIQEVNINNKVISCMCNCLHNYLSLLIPIQFPISLVSVSEAACTVTRNRLGLRSSVQILLHSWPFWFLLVCSGVFDHGGSFVWKHAPRLGFCLWTCWCQQSSVCSLPLPRVTMVPGAALRAQAPQH